MKMPTTLDARPAAIAADDSDCTKVRIASITAVASAAWKTNDQGNLTNPGSRQVQASPVSGSLLESSLRKIRL